MKGRGTGENPENRFQRLHVLYEPPQVNVLEGEDVADVFPSPKTQFFYDASKSVLSENDSPDLSFRYSVNAYRGCEHGCPYCYARPSHEYLGFSAGLDFESKIMVKRDAPALLRKALSAPKWQPSPITFSGNTDCYQPVERRLRLTRQCLEVCAEFLQPIGIITKNALVRRDIDVLQKLASVQAAQVHITLTTLNADLASKLEPRASAPELRLKAIEAMKAAGIPVGIVMAPIIPGLNDEEIPRVLEAAAQAGAGAAGWTLLRLASPLDVLFTSWLEQHLPDRARKVLARIRDCRDGKLNDSTFGDRMRGTGVYAEQIRALFHAASKKHGLDKGLGPLSAAAFIKAPPPTRPSAQLSLF
jgi:DNA repair photolyase